MFATMVYLWIAFPHEVQGFLKKQSSNAAENLVGREGDDEA
jgi:hypothetical protein